MIRGWFSSFCIIIWFAGFLLFSQSTFSQTDQNGSFIKLDPNEFYIQMNLKENKVLFDVRTVREFKKERIPDALLAENSKALFSITDTLDLEQPLFIYCDDEARSSTACTFLIERGFKNVYLLKEGLIGWKMYDLQIDNSRIRWKKIRK